MRYITLSLLFNFALALSPSQAEENSDLDELVEQIIEQDENNPETVDAETSETKIYAANLGDVKERIARAKILMSEQNFSASLELLNSAQNEIAEQNEEIEPALKLEITSLTANIKYLQNDYAAAVKNFHEAIELAVTSDLKTELPYLYARIAYSYVTLDPTLSVTYLNKAIKLNLDKNDKIGLSENYYNLAIIQKQLGNLLEAKATEKKYQALSKETSSANFYRLAKTAQSNEYRIDDIITPEGKNYRKAEYVDLQILNKLDGFSYQYELRIGSKMTFKTLQIITKACLKSDPVDQPENMLLIEINETDKINPKKNQKLDYKNIFSGWMFSASPSLNSLEHPLYDVRVMNCRIKQII